MIYQSINLTPIKGYLPNYTQQLPGYDFLKSLGARDAFMVTDGTLCDVGHWYDPGTVSLIPPEKLPGPIGHAPNNNPPVQWAVQACAKLTAYANTYMPDPKAYAVEDHIPIIFDLENPAVGFNPVWDSEDVIAEKVRTMAEAVRWARSWSDNNFTQVGAFMWPSEMPLYNARNWMDPEFYARSGMREYIDVASFAAPDFYFWNVPAINPTMILDDIDRCTSFLDRFASHLPRWAVITPTYQVFNADDANDPTGRARAVAGKAVDAGTWDRMVRYLVERDYDLFVWNAEVGVPGVKDLLRGMVKYVG